MGLFVGRAVGRAQPAADEPLSYRELFEEVWTVVAENFVGPAPGVDWFAVRDEYERKVTSARSDEEAYRYLAEDWWLS